MKRKLSKADYLVELGKITRATDQVTQELYRATDSYGPMASPHEGWAVIKEEMDELWEIVRLKPALRDKKRMREEATQIAAMATRFIVDLT